MKFTIAAVFAIAAVKAQDMPKPENTSVDTETTNWEDVIDMGEEGMLISPNPMEGDDWAGETEGQNEIRNQRLDAIKDMIRAFCPEEDNEDHWMGDGDDHFEGDGDNHMEGEHVMGDGDGHF